jgi:hypothetical protein
MSPMRFTTSVSLALLMLPALYAAPRCPGNVASVPLRLVNRHWIILPVFISRTGPYNFLLDSGAQITMVDPTLAAGLHLDTHGAAVVAGVRSGQSASYAQLDMVEVGAHRVAKQKVLVHDFQNLHSADARVQGILGEDFLDKFDLLIDNAHRLLCLDDSGAMRQEVRGPHIPLVDGAQAEEVGAPPGLLLITVELSGGLRPVLLVVDSGANESLLFNTSEYMLQRPSHDLPVSWSGVDGSQLSLSALPPQDVKIGSLKLPGVSFFSLDKDPFVKGFDGVLSTGLFRRVFIDRAHSFAVLEPR